MSIQKAQQTADQALVSSGIPSGAVMPFAMATSPTGWLIANGATVSRTTYASLFAAIGTLYGAGDGSTTFKLPDLRGEFIRGLDATRGVDAGRVIGTAQTDTLQGHHHTLGLFTNAGTGADAYKLNYSYAAGGTANWGTWYGSEGVKAAIDDGANGAPRTGTETRPRNIALLYCIKI